MAAGDWQSDSSGTSGWGHAGAGVESSRPAEPRPQPGQQTRPRRPNEMEFGPPDPWAEEDAFFQQTTRDPEFRQRWERDRYGMTRGELDFYRQQAQGDANLRRAYMFERYGIDPNRLANWNPAGDAAYRGAAQAEAQRRLQMDPSILTRYPSPATALAALEAQVMGDRSFERTYARNTFGIDPATGIPVGAEFFDPSTDAEFQRRARALGTARADQVRRARGWEATGGNPMGRESMDFGDLSGLDRNDDPYGDPGYLAAARAAARQRVSAMRSDAGRLPANLPVRPISPLGMPLVFDEV